MRRAFMCNYKEVIEYITSSRTWTVPAGVSSIDIFLVSGGGGGGGWNNWGHSIGGAGGGGGSLARSRNLGNAIPVTPGTLVTIVIGSGGEGGKGYLDGKPGADGAPTRLTVNGVTYQTEAVGKGGSGSVYQSDPPTAKGGNQGHNGIYNNSTNDGDHGDPAPVPRYGTNGVHEFWEADRPIHAAGGNLTTGFFNKTDFSDQTGQSPVGTHDGITIHAGQGGGGYGGGGGGGYYGTYTGDKGGRGGNGVCVIRYLKQM